MTGLAVGDVVLTVSKPTAQAGLTNRAALLAEHRVLLPPVLARIWLDAFQAATDGGADAATAASKAWRAVARAQGGASKKPQEPTGIPDDSLTWNPDTLANAMRRERRDASEFFNNTKEGTMTLREKLTRALNLAENASIEAITGAVERLLLDEQQLADPRLALDVAAKKLMVEKGIEYMKALGEAKAQHPELVEQVAGIYATTG